MWLVRTGPIWILTKDALCVLDLAPDEPAAYKTFTTTETIERFNVLVSTGGKDRIRLTLASQDTDYFIGTIPGRQSFTCGRNTPPGRFIVMLERQAGHRGARVVVSGKPSAITGWQVLISFFVLGVIGSGIWAEIARKSSNAKHRKTSVYLFTYFLLVVTMLFLYLLFHEGGHALASAMFGRYDFAGSDFWGIRGNPHSGVKISVPLKPWQRSIGAFGGPALPTLVGWLLFGLWRMKRVTEWRRNRPTLNLFSTFILFMCIFPWIAVAGYLLGICSDGDWRGFIENVPGPMWLVKSLLWTSVAVSALMIWRVIPEMKRCFKERLVPAKVARKNAATAD
jgi:hypothetical protein